jgi:hypothetical protein
MNDATAQYLAGLLDKVAHPIFTKGIVDSGDVPEIMQHKIRTGAVFSKHGRTSVLGCDLQPALLGGAARAEFALFETVLGSTRTC